MALKMRVIPVLLWDDRGLTKPIQFQRPGRFIGSLMSSALLYENRGCDELIILDIDATPKKRSPRHEQIKQFTSKLMCPVAVGGGIEFLDDIRQLLLAGADKVVLKTHAKTSFVKEASRKFGAQCITIAIDYQIDRNISLASSINTVIEKAKEMEKAGAGEIILTNMDHDGCRVGYDLRTLKDVSSAVSIPVIANGGCSSPANMVQAARHGAHAVAAATMFLYDDVTPLKCKKIMDAAGIPVRIENEVCS